MKIVSTLFAVAMVAVPLMPMKGETYQYIVSGYPAASPSHSSRSDVIGITTSSLRAAGANDVLEARSRTRCASSPRTLKSTKPRGVILLVM